MGLHVPHLTRTPVKSGHPVLVSVRLVDGLPSLRRRDLLRVVYRAIRAANAGDRIRIVHFCVLKNHVHLLVEAQGRTALARGMQGFCIRMAKGINQALGRNRGTVFRERYDGQVLTTPRRTRTAINYVLQNHRRHGWHGRTPGGAVLLDPYSSAEQFDGFVGRLAHTVHALAPPQVPVPHGWLLRAGWRRAGGAIPIDRAPPQGAR